MRNLLQSALPLPVALMLVIQTGGFVWWYSSQMNSFSTSLVETQLRVSNIEDKNRSDADFGSRIIVLEQNSIRIRDDLAEIKALLRMSAPTQKADREPPP